MLHPTPFRALLAGLLFGLATPAMATPSITSPRDLCGAAGPVDLDAVIARAEFVAVHMNFPLRQPQPPQQQSAQSRSTQTVVIDGIVLELPAWVIEGMIDNGTFIPVYPGTQIPIGRSEWPHELPCWANPDCP